MAPLMCGIINNYLRHVGKRDEEEDLRKSM